MKPITAIWVGMLAVICLSIIVDVVRASYKSNKDQLIIQKDINKMKFILRHKETKEICDKDYYAEIHMNGSFSVIYLGNKIPKVKDNKDYELILVQLGKKHIMISATPDPEDPDLDLEKLKGIVQSLQDLGPDPLIAYMKREGFDPEKGGIMIWPVSKPGFWLIGMQPYYIQVSNLVNDIQLIYREWYGEK